MKIYPVNSAYMRALNNPKWMVRLIEVRTRHVAAINVAVEQRLPFSFLFSTGHWETVWYENAVAIAESAVDDYNSLVDSQSY